MLKTETSLEKASSSPQGLESKNLSIQTWSSYIPTVDHLRLVILTIYAAF
jgi:hypothetical protein